jgi:hypothetical protein
VTGGSFRFRPKLNLVSGLHALLHEERLKIHRELPEAPVLVSELRNFRVDFTAGGQMTFSARSGTHDLVLALAIAVWRAKSARGSPLLSFYRMQMLQARNGTMAQMAPTPAAGAEEGAGCRAMGRGVKCRPTLGN